MINHPLATGEDLLQVSGILVLSGGDTLEGSGGKTVLGAGHPVCICSKMGV